MSVFRRPPRLREIVEAVEAAFPQPPSPPRKYPRTPVMRILLMAMLPTMLPPVALGLVTYFVGSPGTIAITAGALTVSMGLAITITTLMSRRDEDARMRADQHDYETQRAEYEEAVAATGADAERAVEREAAILGREFPAPAQLCRRAAKRSSTTWERRPGDGDFLELRLGLGVRPTCVQFSKEARHSNDPAAAPVIQKLSHHQSAPITVTFAPGARAGMFGQEQAVTSQAAALVMQTAAFHAPGELTIAVLSRDESLCGWAKWLPHCKVDTGKNGTRLVARSGAEANAVFRAIAADMSSRAASGNSSRYFIVADGRSWDSLAARMARWLPGTTDALSILLVKDTYEELSGDCEFVIDLRDPTRGQVLRQREPGEAPAFAPDALTSDDALTAAISLAPLTLGEAAGGGGVPHSVRLADLLPQARDAATVVEAWSRTRRSFRLAAPIGIGPGDTVVEIDFRRDGPHALLAGTTGSGKSELLQSLVVSLAAKIPPDLLNFLLIDYKGGSAFREVSQLPHVVGVVTDLDERLSARALTSLRAEMKRREHLLGAADPPAANIIEYQSRARAVPLANLLIIIDEFHRLVSEVPDFVDQMVQIAQQGRSLGVHLLLSTQKPSGVISDYIRANTNLRMCLRVTDEADSRDVLGGPEAAQIPRDLPGRVFIRRGNEPLHVCQTGRISGLVPVRDLSDDHIRVSEFLPPLAPRSGSRNGLVVREHNPVQSKDNGAANDAPMLDERDLCVGAIDAAATRAHFPTQQPPWQPYLPRDLALAALAQPVDDAGDHCRIAIGVLDEPEVQRQQAYVIDLAAGHVCVAGAANTGKTSTLLTIAAAAATRLSASELHVYGIDYAGGDLGQLASLSHSGGVAAQHEPSRVAWVLRTLKEIVDNRLRYGSQGAAGSQARILVLVDNFSGFFTALQSADGGPDATDDFYELMDIGRTVGVTFVVSLERPDAMRSGAMALMHTRLALPFADAESYAGFGLPRVAVSADRIYGRALIPGHVVHEAQIALSTLPTGEPEPVVGGPLPIAPLPNEVRYEPAAEAANAVDAGALRLGLRESLTPTFEYPANEHLLILGPRKSGRSNALTVAARELQAAGVAEFFVVNPRRSSSLRRFSEQGEHILYAERMKDVADLWEAVVRRARSDFASYDNAEKEAFPAWAVVVDDADVSELPMDVADLLQQLVLRGSDIGATVVLAADTQALRASYPSGALRALLNLRTGILLRPGTSEDFDLFGVRGKPGRLPAGRGYFCDGGAKYPVQIFLSDHPPA